MAIAHSEESTCWMMGPCLFDLFHRLLMLPYADAPGMGDRNGNVFTHNDKEILTISFLFFNFLSSSTNLGMYLGTAAQETIKQPYPTQDTIQLFV